jgi:hypothetical protein
MNKLKAKFLRSYVKNGKDVFVYAVTGTPEAIEAYKADQGDNLRMTSGEAGYADGTPLFFTPRASIDNTVDLIKTQAGRWIPDNSEIRRVANVVAQFGGNFGQAYAQDYFANRGNTSTATPVVEKEPADLAKK